MLISMPGPYCKMNKSANIEKCEFYDLLHVMSLGLLATHDGFLVYKKTCLLHTGGDDELSF